MELDEPSFLEDLLAIRRPEIWNSDDLFSSEQIPSMDFFPDAAALYPPFDCFNADAYCQMLAGGGMCTYYSAFTQDFPPEISPEMLCKAEAQSAEAEAPPPAADAPTVAPERKKKKVEGMPSKNLMAERRRRKRLNDRLSMLRSVVPKISKMDRTSILGDTIEYMKELLEKIKKLQEDAEAAGGGEQVNLLGLFKDLSPNEILVRNSPKGSIWPQFDVERRDGDTRIEICCASKPGLLLSTVSTLEAFGLDIQQCVISCFNDFGMQASCSENVEQRGVLSPEDIKQALFRNAGYGGRCM